MHPNAAYANAQSCETARPKDQLGVLGAQINDIRATLAGLRSHHVQLTEAHRKLFAPRPSPAPQEKHRSELISSASSSIEDQLQALNSDARRLLEDFSELSSRFNEVL